jgi:arginyl-tRNA synthetase
MIDPDTPMNFDLELAVKKSSDNPVFYVQYAHARISSILKQAEERKIDFKMFEGLSEVKEKEELLLIKELSLFSNVVAEAAKNRKTNFITTYLEKVSSRFHTFYTKHSILNTDNSRLIQARLNICLATKIILERGLALLGVSAPDKM